MLVNLIKSFKNRKTLLSSRNSVVFVPSCGMRRSTMAGITKKTVQQATPTTISNSNSTSAVQNFTNNSSTISGTSNSTTSSVFFHQRTNVSYSCPILNKTSMPISFDPIEKIKINIKNVVDNYSLNSSNNPVKLKITNKLPLKSSYPDTLKNIEFQAQRNPEDSVLQSHIENPNHFFLSEQNRPIKLQDAENLSSIVTTEDFCGIQVLPGSDLLTKCQNVKVFSAVCTIQHNDERHIFLGTIKEIFPDGSIKIFGSFYSSNTIVHIGNQYEYLLEMPERILGSEQKLQGFSIPKDYILNPGWTFLVKFVLNPKPLAQGISIVIHEENNPKTINHLTDPQKIYEKTLQEAQKIEQALNDKAAALGLVENLVSSHQSPLGNFVNSGKGNSNSGNGGNSGGNSGNLPPI